MDAFAILPIGSCAGNIVSNDLNCYLLYFKVYYNYKQVCIADQQMKIMSGFKEDFAATVNVSVFLTLKIIEIQENYSISP